MILQSTNAFARENNRGGERGGNRGRSREVVTVGHQRYSYQDGRFYKPGMFWFRMALGIPPLRAVAHFLPSRYVVVPKPVVSQSVVVTQNYSGERVSINILNSNGSYTTITLVRQGDGYLGPQGEYYPGNPTIEQLRSLYGK